MKSQAGETIARFRYPDPMLTALDHGLFLVLAALLPLWALWVGRRALERASADDLPRVRLNLYRRAILIQWTLTALTLGLWAWVSRSWREIGLVPAPTPGLVGVALGLAIVTILVVRQRAQALVDDEALARVRRQLQSIERMIPRSPRELSWFYRLSVTAGVCEELLYRGFMIWYLSHWLGLLPAAALTALLFGLGHSYQGLRGILLTTLVGGFLGALYLLTGSLLAPVVFHALMDAHSGHLGYAAFRREREVEAEDLAQASWESEGGAGQSTETETSFAPGPGEHGGPEVDETTHG